MTLRRFCTFAALCGVFFTLSACGSDSSGGTRDGADNDPPGDLDDIPVDDADGGLDVDEAAPTGTRCPEDAESKPQLAVFRVSGGAVRLCDPASPIDGAAMVIPPRGGVSADAEVRVTPGDDIRLDGWRAVGPAVAFTSAPGGATKAGGAPTLLREASIELPLTLPLPDKMRDYHVNVLFVPQGQTKALFVTKNQATIRIDRERRVVRFADRWFGTYRVVVPERPNPIVQRNYQYRAVGGVSMGGGGSAMLGLLHPDKFDFVAPLGGISDMVYLHMMVRKFLMGGFCTYEQYMDMLQNHPERLNDPGYRGCGECLVQLDPQNPAASREKCFVEKPRDPVALKNPDEYPQEHVQGFNHWYYDTEGGNFDRGDYHQIFRDLAFAFGNPLSYNPASPLLPAGMDISMLKTGAGLGDDRDPRCKPVDPADPSKGMRFEPGPEVQGYPVKKVFDREFNPEGRFDAIVPCDGANSSGDFTPAGGTGNPLVMGLAVDYNGNGVRDYAEPLMRQSWEPFEDCGLDGLCNKDEPGWSAANPDPAGDDYNWLTNQAGTEANFRWDCRDAADPDDPTRNGGAQRACERYEDLGLDGVRCPQAGACPHDFGEANAKFDYSPNLLRWFSVDPRTIVEKLPVERLKTINVWMDGGVRDIFNFGMQAQQLWGAFRGRGEQVTLFEDFPALNPRDGLETFNFLRTDFGKLGRTMFLRYGNVNATNDEIVGGNGRHLGGVQGVVNRLLSVLAFVSFAWPKGDFTPLDGALTTQGLLKTDYFYSENLSRDMKYSVALPPGYNDDPTKRFPVLYLMHGYGMTPNDFSAALAIAWPYMQRGTMQKFITVFPDGKCYTPDVCRGDCRDVKCITDTINNGSPEWRACVDQCYVRSNCDNVDRECVRGNFYANAAATWAYPAPKPGDPKRGQIIDGFFDLAREIESKYRVRTPETLDSDSVNGEWAY